MHRLIYILYRVSMKRAKEEIIQKYIPDIHNNVQEWFRSHNARWFWCVLTNARGREFAETEQKEKAETLWKKLPGSNVSPCVIRVCRKSNSTIARNNFIWSSNPATIGWSWSLRLSVSFSILFSRSFRRIVSSTLLFASLPINEWAATYLL